MTQSNQAKAFTEKVDKLIAIEQRARIAFNRIDLISTQHKMQMQKIKSAFPEQWKKYCAENNLSEKYTIKEIVKEP